MRRVLFLLLGVLSLTVGLTACDHSNSGPDSGVVTDTNFDSAHDDTIMNCASYGKYGCQMYVPMTTHYDDHWEVKLRNGTAEGWCDVDRATYAATRVGDHLNLGRGGCS